MQICHPATCRRPGGHFSCGVGGGLAGRVRRGSPFAKDAASARNTAPRRQGARRPLGGRYPSKSPRAKRSALRGPGGVPLGRAHPEVSAPLLGPARGRVGRVAGRLGDTSYPVGVVEAGDGRVRGVHRSGIPPARKIPSGPESGRSRAPGGAAYSMSSKILNIGRYIAMMIPPTMPPTTTIIKGSMMEVSALTAASTSDS